MSNRFFHLKTCKIPLVNLHIKWRKKSGLKNTYEPTFKLTFTFFPYHSIRFKRWNSIVTKAQRFKYGKYLNTIICHYFVGFLKSNMCLLSGKFNSKGLFWQWEVYSFVLIAFPFSECRCLIIKTKIEPLSLLIDKIAMDYYVMALWLSSNIMPRFYGLFLQRLEPSPSTQALWYFCAIAKTEIQWNSW